MSEYVVAGLIGAFIGLILGGAAFIAWIALKWPRWWWR